MIASISLANFKCFKSLNLELRSLNVFAGMNGAGKSTVIQSLLALRQSWESNSLLRNRIQLNGKLAELGTAAEVYCAEPGSDFIELNFNSARLGRNIGLKCRQAEIHSKDYTLLSEIVWDRLNGEFELFQEPFNYLHAERIGPRKSMQIPPDDGHPYSVGRFGENASYIIASDLKNRVVHSALALAGADENTYPLLQFQWELWMARIFPGFAADPEINSKADQVRVAMALQRKTGQSLYVRPPNTGFGLSFVQGIIVAGLVAQPDTVLIVENPEAHLHPKAQSGLGEFLARVAAGGAQVFVETHSEHVLNGMRRMVKQAVLTPADIRLFYFANTEGEIEPKVTPIPVSPTGDIAIWPDGFFDQLDQDLSIILG
jgi:predicted ATPase